MSFTIFPSLNVLYILCDTRIISITEFFLNKTPDELNTTLDAEKKLDAKVF